jgi:hypothetical protein
LVLSLNASLPAIRKKVDTLLHANPLWNGGTSEVMISEPGETPMVVRISLGAANPELAFQLGFPACMSLIGRLLAFL